MRKVLKLLSFAFALAIAAGISAASADTARIGFGKDELSCEVDFWMVADTMARRGIAIFELVDVTKGEFVLTVYDVGTATPHELVEEFRELGYEAFLLGPDAVAAAGPI